MNNIKNTYSLIKKDLTSHGGKSLKTMFLVFLFDPSFRLLLNFRIGKYLSKHQISFFRFLGKYYKYKQVVKRNCDISYNAQIGCNVKFLHPLGVVIGENVIIKDDVRIWQHVTFGSHGKLGAISAYPVIEAGVRIYTGAAIIGQVNIGENCIIGANSVVNRSLPANSTALGIPAKVIDK